MHSFAYSMVFGSTYKVAKQQWFYKQAEISSIWWISQQTPSRDWYIGVKCRSSQKQKQTEKQTAKQTSETNSETLMIIFKAKALSTAEYASNPKRASFTESLLYFGKDKTAEDGLYVIAAK